MTDYFQTLDAVGTGVPTKVSAPAIKKTVTGTGTATKVSQPQKVLTRTPSAAVPALVRTPKIVRAVTATAVVTKSSGWLRTISTTLTGVARMFFGRQGAGGFSVPMAERKWDAPVDERKWSADAYARFTFTVFGD